MNQDMDKPHGSNIRFVKAATERNVLCDFVRVKCKRQAKLSYGVRGPGSTQGCLGGDQKGTQGLCWGAGKVPVLDLVAMTPMGSLWEVHSWFAPFPYTRMSPTPKCHSRESHICLDRQGPRRGEGEDPQVPASPPPGITFTPELPGIAGVVLLPRKTSTPGWAVSTGRCTGFGDQESVLP